MFAADASSASTFDMLNFPSGSEGFAKLVKRERDMPECDLAVRDLPLLVIQATTHPVQSPRHVVRRVAKLLERLAVQVLVRGGEVVAILARVLVRPRLAVHGQRIVVNADPGRDVSHRLALELAVTSEHDRSIP